MGHHHLGNAGLAQVADDLGHLLGDLGIEGSSRLVKQQHFRVHHQGTGNGHPLLLTAGETGRPGIALVGQLQLGQQIGPLLDGSLLAHAEHLDRRFNQILHHSEMWPEIVLLEHHPHLATQQLGLAVEFGSREGVRERKFTFTNPQNTRIRGIQQVHHP